MRFLFAFLVFAGVGLHVGAQIPGSEPSSGYKVGTITVRFLGSANVNEQLVRANMQVREGTDLDETQIDRDIRSLYRTKLFEFIEVKREVTPDRIVNLVVEVTPKFRVLAVRYDGNKKIRSRRLEKEIQTRANEALDERQVKEDAEKIREYYQRNGYNQVAVNYSIERDRETGFGTVVFNINEGAKVKIADIRFVGNEHIKARRIGNWFNGELVRQMETRRWWFMSWLTNSGRFKDDVFEDDLDKLRDYYRDRGFLDVEIPPEKVIYEYPTPKKLVVTIQIDEGRQYRVGDIKFSGNKLYSSRLLNRVLRQRSGAVFSPSKLDTDVESLEDYYGRGGYLETRVHPIRKPNITTGAIDIEYQINESEKYYVESVRIEGNTKTKSLVILRELVLGPGEVFNTVRMKTSKLRLENTRYFSDVNLSPETTNIPGRRNLKISVTEERTGNLTFGAGYSSLSGLVFYSELTQSNFDLFNRRSFFQGDGQKFRLRLQIGSRSSEIILSFEEPWLLQKELALGFQIYHTSTNYDNTFYDDTRTGGQVYLRKRLFELVEGTLSYSYESVEISDVDPSYASFLLEGEQQISKVGFQLLRDTRDRIVSTTSGNRVELNTEVAGGALKGDLDIYRIEFRGSQFFPVFETQTQVLALIGRLGIVDDYGRTTSFATYRASEGYFLGGPYSLRGFENRDVGPKNRAGQPLGGKSYGFVSAEYSVEVVGPIRFAMFYDGGFVNPGAYDFSPTTYNDNWGFGIRMFVAGAPLSLDYGIPLTVDRFNDKGGQFNFSFGTRF